MTNEEFKNKILIARGSQSSVYRVSCDEFFSLREIEKNINMSSNGEFILHLQQEWSNLTNLIKFILHLQAIVADYCPFN